jgi:predicted anti-sigma-YlaC factor YlaD
MRCEEFRALWDAEMESASPETAARVEEHLKTCDNCPLWLEAKIDRDAMSQLLRALGPSAFHKKNDPSTS